MYKKYRSVVQIYTKSSPCILRIKPCQFVSLSKSNKMIVMISPSQLRLNTSHKKLNNKQTQNQHCQTIFYHLGKYFPSFLTCCYMILLCKLYGHQFNLFWGGCSLSNKSWMLPSYRLRKWCWSYLVKKSSKLSNMSILTQLLFKEC